VAVLAAEAAAAHLAEAEEAAEGLVAFHRGDPEVPLEEVHLGGPEVPLAEVHLGGPEVPLAEAEAKEHQEEDFTVLPE